MRSDDRMRHSRWIARLSHVYERFWPLADMPGSFYRRLRGFGNDIGIRRTALNRRAEMPARNQAGVVAGQAGRESGVLGKSVSVPVDLGGSRIITEKSGHQTKTIVKQQQVPQQILSQ